jgi:hypothetical protein
MEKPCLNDKAEYPSDEVLSRCLGELKQTWDSFIEMIREDCPAFTGEWRYYNDGKSWLYKITRKKQTICWVSVCDRLFKTTFYFPDRAEDAIVASKLKKEYIDQFTQGRRYGKIRGVTVSIKRRTDLSATRTLMEIKVRVK